MKNWIFVLSALLAGSFLLISCSGGDPASSDLTPVRNQTDSQSAGQTQLWGYYHVYVDVENMEASVVLNRTAMFTANCVNLLNNSTGNGIEITIYGIGIDPDYMDIDLGVSLRHPFPGLDQFQGYDVRGVFMGDGAGTLDYNSDLIYPIVNTDQSFQPGLADPEGADGYTRWFNYSEFQGPGMPLFTYTDGNMGSSGFEGTATLCPYKYFTDGLDADESVTDFLEANPADFGVFSAGAVNARDYSLRFPTSKPVKFGYAVVANWSGPDIHPANAPEPVACRVEQSGDVYYQDPDNWGGDIALTIDVFDWGEHQFSGAMDDYQIHIESNALLSVYSFNSADMTPIGGGENYSTYYTEVAADNLTSAVGNELWLIVETTDFDYSNELDIMNDAWDDALTSFFRYDLEVANFMPSNAPVCDLVINECTLGYWDITDHVGVEFDATGSYDPDGDPITFHWDFDGDDIYDEPGDDDYTGDPDNPSHVYEKDGTASLKVIDEFGAESTCLVDVDITEFESKNIPLREDWLARDLAVDPSNGELHVLYYYYDVDNDNHYTETMKYLPCDLYTEPPDPFHVTNEGARYIRLDVSSTHYSLIGGPTTGASGKVRNIDPDGNDLGPNWIINCRELWAFNDSDKWPFDHVTLYGWYNPPWNPGGHITYVYRAPYNTQFDTWHQAANIYWDTEEWTGHDKLFGNYVAGVEPVAYGNSFWCLKDPGDGAIEDYYITRWRLDDPGTFTGANYDGAWYGSGLQTEADDGWYDAQDLTRNVEDILLVLDELSDGSGRVKAFTGDDSGGAPVGAFDVPSDVNDTPIRIDSSDYKDPVYGNLIYVLHGDRFTGFLLSIFFDEELPW